MSKKRKMNDFEEVLEMKRSKREEFHVIKSKQHQLSTISMNKISLSPFDDKRFINNDGITSRPYN